MATGWNISHGNISKVFFLSGNETFEDSLEELCVCVLSSLPRRKEFQVPLQSACDFRVDVILILDFILLVSGVRVSRY